MRYCKFLELYRKYTENTETPEIIHLWVGLSTLAGACEKRLWIDRGLFKIYLNLYVVLVGPPGVVAKSTSISLGRDMLKKLGFNVFEDSVLKEKIVQEMCELEKAVEVDGKPFYHSSITYIASELNVLLASGVDMIKFLVNIWDKDDLFTYKTKNSGVYEINNPYFNLIGAAVPEWFGTNVIADMNSTGFLARLIIVYEDQKRGKVPDPTPTPEQLEAKREAMKILNEIGSMCGPLTFTQEATDFYNDWYTKQEIDTTQDYRIVGYLERKVKTHVLKIAGLMAVGDLRKEITVVDFERAIHILDRIEPRMRTAILLSGANRIAPYVQKAVALLDARGGEMPIKDVVRAFYTELNKDQFKELIELLEDLGYAETRVSGGKKFLVRASKQ